MPVMANGSKKVVLTDEQQSIVDQILRFPKQVQVLGGLAGTGKSVVAAELKNKLPKFAVCAYTGKAASVLRKRGIGASTVHSLIYNVFEDEYWDEEEEELRVKLAFSLKDADSVGCQGFIIDESSMIASGMDADLRSFGLPIIYIGDHGQLPPVASGVLDMMKNPDYTLETLHRNAGEIARFAEFLRHGNHCTNWECEDKVTTINHHDHIENGFDDHYKADQIIVAFNRDRVRFNMEARNRLGFPPERPIVSDRIMCLKNDKEINIYNGQQGVISAIDYEKKELLFTVDGISHLVHYDLRSFNCEKHQELFQYERIHYTPFDYCYAATCHKCQGSEENFVAVIEQRCSAWDHRRWSYTAASRAKEKLLWIY